MSEFFITYTNSFVGISIFSKFLVTSQWNLRVDFSIDDENIESDLCLQITTSKINFIVEEMLNMGIFFSKTNTWASKIFSKTNNNFILCPSDPISSHLAVLLKSKFNAIAEPGIEIPMVEVTGDNLSGLTFSYYGESETLPSMEEWFEGENFFDQPWWKRPDASTFDISPKPKDDLSIKPDFAFDLDFISDEFKTPKSRPAKIIKPNFKPKIIKGGQHLEKTKLKNED